VDTKYRIKHFRFLSIKVFVASDDPLELKALWSISSKQCKWSANFIIFAALIKKLVFYQCFKQIMGNIRSRACRISGIVLPCYCRSVGIASLSLISHTAAMLKFIVVFLLFTMVSTQVSGNATLETKQDMVYQAQQWVAHEIGVNVAQVEIKAVDRRLKVPRCSSAFGINFAYSGSQKTIRVACEETNWQVFIGVKITSEKFAWVFSRNLEAGIILTENHVLSTKVTSQSKGLITELHALTGKSLVKSVRKGEPVLKQYFVENSLVYKLGSDVLRGEMIGLTNVVEIKQANHLTTALRLLESATAANDLRKGMVLRREDLHVKQKVMLAQSTILKGQLLTSENTRLTDYYGDLPSDVIVSQSGVIHMEALRTLHSEQLIRASDLRVASMIKKGESVTLTIGAGSLRISTPMVALESGKLNQQITLLNPDSDKRVRAIVSGPGQARGIK
jgi:flagella basal body P-ring formation protein FlgA